MGYPDTEYEYFEQRGGLARPTLMNAGGGGPPLPPGMPMGGPGAPLLPQETAKLDNRHEEVRANKDTLEYLTDVTSLESSNRDRSIQCNLSRIPNIPIRSPNVLSSLENSKTTSSLDNSNQDIKIYSNLPQKCQFSKGRFRINPFAISSTENSPNSQCIQSNLPQKYQFSKKHFRSTPLVMSSAENSKDGSFLEACNEISSVENSMYHE